MASNSVPTFTAQEYRSILYFMAYRKMTIECVSGLAAIQLIDRVVNKVAKLVFSNLTLASITPYPWIFTLLKFCSYFFVMKDIGRQIALLPAPLPEFCLIALALANACFYFFSTNIGALKKSAEAPDFLIDMAKMVEKDKDSLILADEKRVKQLELALRFKLKPHTVLVGKTGIGKSALMQTVALRMQEKQIDPHSSLFGKRIFFLDHNAFTSHTSFVGQTNEKVMELVQFTEANPDVIVFMDEFSLIMGAGRSASNPTIGVAQYLKTAITQNKIRIIGACTEDEYNKLVSEDPAFKRRFKKVSIDEPSAEVCLQILKHRLKKDLAFEGLEFTEEALKAMVAVTSIVHLEFGQPDKAITLMGEIAARAFEWEDKKICPKQVFQVYTEQEKKLSSIGLLQWYLRFQKAPAYKRMFPSDPAPAQAT